MENKWCCVWPLDLKADSKKLQSLDLTWETYDKIKSRDTKERIMPLQKWKFNDGYDKWWIWDE